jgi:phytoene dehydrogenase-like protein
MCFWLLASGVSVQQNVYDVAIIGGGSSGTYTAIQLQKAGKSVAVIERNGRLGGHVNTYIDPVTGGTMDYGVM